MRYLIIAFTLKGQSFEQIKGAIAQLSAMTGGKGGGTVLVHGFMPREVVLEKGFNPEVVDALQEYFPKQLNCFSNGVPQREIMADIIKATNGEVYTIGEVKEGVLEEVGLYQKNKVNILNLPLDWNGNMVGRPLSEGEYRVRINFNASGSSLVNKIKWAGANFINLVNDMDLEKELSPRDAASFGRLKSLTMTEIEHATSDAVKAATV